MRSILLVPALLLSGCALTQQSTPIQPDANWHVNQLSNGMKYHIYPTQDQEVSVRLVMHIGSFQEEANQKGYAHFVEHMAFNGSTHFTGNDVVKLFEQSGGSFGADINAFTTYQQTSYKLDLANNDKLEDALTWMRDIGDGLEFAPAQVEKEKGVVLGEWRRANPDDKSFSMHAYEASIEGTPYAEHDPIGTRDAIENATSNGLKNFYEKWYQPQYAELIVTGNVDAKSLANIIKNKFSNWESTSDIAIEKRRDIRLNTQDEILPSNSMESPSLHLVIERGDLRRETVEQQHAEWRDEVAIQLIQQRLISLLNDAAEPYQYVYAQPYYSNYQRLMSAGISFSPDRREQMHQIFISALTPLRDYGVTQAELESITSNWYGELANLDSDWSKRKPNSYAEARIFQLEQDSVSQSKESYAQSLAAFLDKTKLESVNAQLKELLSNQPSFVIGMGKSETQAQFADVFTALNSAYLQAGGRAYIYFTSQGGKAALDKSLYPAYELAAMTAVRSGLGEFSGSELDAYLRTNNIAFGPILEPTVHGVQVTTQKNRLVEALNGLYNLSTEIKVDERQLAAVKQEFKQERSAFLESPMGTLIQVANTSAYTPDSRHRLLSSDGADTVTPEQILAVHDQLFKTDHGYKMVIVADVEPEQITPLLRKYVASIKMKPGKAVDYRVSFNDELPARLVFTDGHEPSSFYLLRFTNTDKYNRTAKDTVIEDILERISAARVLETFREESSLDYSPSIYTMTQDGEPISDWLFESQVDPKDVGLMDKLLDKVFDDLAINITQKEVDTAAKQLAVAMQGLGDNPGSRAWVYSRYLAHDYGLDVVLDVEKAAKSVTLEEVKARAASAFGPNAKRSALILNPM